MTEYATLQQAYAAACKERDELRKRVPGHAHWEVAIGYDTRKMFRCSACCKMNFQADEFCPHCGFVMDEE